MPRAKHGPVRRELEKTLASDPKLAGARYAALVSLCRVTADQMDAAGPEVASRLIASYLSALKDLDRALGDKKPAASDGSAGSTLGALRGIAGGKSA